MCQVKLKIRFFTKLTVIPHSLVAVSGSEAFARPDCVLMAAGTVLQCFREALSNSMFWRSGRNDDVTTRQGPICISRVELSSFDLLVVFWDFHFWAKSLPKFPLEECQLSRKFSLWSPSSRNFKGPERDRPTLVLHFPGKRQFVWRYLAFPSGMPFTGMLTEMVLVSLLLQHYFRMPFCSRRRVDVIEKLSGKSFFEGDNPGKVGWNY